MIPYIIAQVLGSTLASATLVLTLDVGKEDYFGTLPVGPNLRSLIMEFIATFFLMFVVSGVATDSRAVRNSSINSSFESSLAFQDKIVFNFRAFHFSDWRVGRNCGWNDNNAKCVRCWVIFSIPLTLKYITMNSEVQRCILTSLNITDLFLEHR